ncbi:MAG: ferredoxin, partial [Actinomycetales bacterium]
MRIEWDESTCRKHGQCEIAAPELFQLDTAGNLRVQRQVPVGLEEDAWAAA